MHTSLRCSGCNRNNLIVDPDSGEVICNSCGLVVVDKIQVAEHQGRSILTTYASFQLKDLALPPNVPSVNYDIESSTIIDRSNTDAKGHRLDPTTTSTMQRLRAWDFRIRTDANAARNMKQALNELDALKDKLGLPDVVVEKAAYIYKKAQGNGLVHGRSISAILCTAVYIACREMGTPRTLKEIAKTANLERRDIARDYRLLVIELDLKIPLIDPLKCIVGIANRTRISEKTKRSAIASMNQITQKEISAGKNPMGIAATVLYMSCLRNRESRTQADIARAAGITEVTLRNRYSELKRHRLQI
jgi:transcription initiation factor TFIIB